MRLVSLALALFLAGPALAQTLTPSDPRVLAAIDHAAGRARAMGASAADVADFAVTNAYADARSGLAYVYLRQTLDGIQVAGSELTITMGRDGRPVYAAGISVVGLVERAENRTAVLSASAAVLAAAGAVGLAAPALAVAESGSGPERPTTFVTPETALAPLTARLVYHAGESGPVRLAWEVGPLETEDGPHAWMIRVDAETGAELWRADLTAHDPIDPVLLQGSATPLRDEVPWLFRPSPAATPDQYRVYPAPMEGPNEGERVLMVDPAEALASPFGWHDVDGLAGAEYTITRGNNVHAYLDVDNDGGPDAGLDVDGGPTLTFDFPIDLTLHPSTYRPAAVTNNFFWSNFIHDIAYQYGFTEAAGNFQVNNYGRGGVGNDDLRAEAQDGGGTNNANFSTPADGSRPRMQMYLYTLTNPFRDGDLSNMTLVHEYTHGISNRLTGGPTVTGCLSNSEQMGEGWSDWLAAMLTMETGDTRTTHRPYGTYPRGLSPTGPGLRPAALNTDFAFNNYHYGHTRTGHPVNGTLAVPHGIGFVWSTVIWEVAWEMIDAYGFSPNFYDANGTAGNQMMIRLVVEGMKLQQCRPGFVSGRDAILAADQALYGGAHLLQLWTGFARRGVGFSASEGSTTTNSDNMEAFDLPFPPAQAAVTPGSISVNVPNGGTVDRGAQLSNLAPSGSQDLNFTAAIVDVVSPPSEAPAPDAPSDAEQGGEYFVVTPTSGAVGPGEDTTLTVTFDASQPPAGVHTATLRITTNDPGNTSIDVPLTMTAGGAIALGDGAGWRMLAAPSPGLTVDSLAAQNLVEGIPGYYPTEDPNLFTRYSGTTWTPPAGGADSLAQGRGFLWYFYDETFDPGGPSQSVELPMTLEAPTSLAPVPSGVAVELHATGDRWNLVGNPFRSALDVTDLSTWATAGALTSAVGQVWDPGPSSYRLTTVLADRIAAWQGMMVENATATGLSIPASAQTDGGVFQGLAGRDARMLALTLESTDGTTGAALVDHAIVALFHNDAGDAWDLRDASKLTPLSASYALLAFEGLRDGNAVLKAQESRSHDPGAPFDLTLDFDAVGTGTSFTVRWPQLVNFPEDWQFELLDVVTSTTTNLRTVASYTFTATPAAPNTPNANAPVVATHAAGSTRFVLHITPGISTGTPPGLLPSSFALAPPAPNPTSGVALVRYDVPQTSDVSIEVFDLVGRRVTVLLDESVEAGRHTVRLDAGTLAAGVYVVRMRAGGFTGARRVVVPG